MMDRGKPCNGDNHRDKRDSTTRDSNGRRHPRGRRWVFRHPALPRAYQVSTRTAALGVLSYSSPAHLKRIGQLREGLPTPKGPSSHDPSQNDKHAERVRSTSVVEKKVAKHPEERGTITCVKGMLNHP